MSGPVPSHHALPWRRIVTVTLVIAVGVSVLWAFIQAFDDTGVDPVDPTNVSSAAATTDETPPAASPTAIPSTPVVAPEWAAGSLPAMLGQAPDRLADGSLPLYDVARYADIAGWMAAAGIATPTSLDDPALAVWEAQLDLLALPSSLRERGLDPEWERSYGFSLLDVSQVLSVGQAPDYVMFLRGDFDPAVLQAAWVASGYQAVEVEGQTIWSLVPGETIDLSAPESRPAMGTLNNVVLLDDGTLVAAARTSRLASVLQVDQGDAPSLAANEDVAALLLPGTRIEDLASAVIAKGSLLAAPAQPVTGVAATPPGPHLAASPLADPAMPDVRLVLVGIPVASAAPVATPGAEPSVGELVVVLVVEDRDAARQARPYVDEALANDRSPVTGAPYAERFGDPDIVLGFPADEQDPAAVTITATLERGYADWLAIVQERDFGFAAWTPED